jgi:hypothetical protein
VPSTYAAHPAAIVFEATPLPRAGVVPPTPSWGTCS